MNQKLKGKVALVTGSSRGIGAAIAKLFAREGAHVALSGRDIPALETVQNEITGFGGQSVAIPADVTRTSDVEALRRRTEEIYGPIDLLVANAGGSTVSPGLFEDLTDEAWEATQDANLTSSFLTIRSVLPGMKARRGGNILTVSSQAGHRPHPMAPIPYAVAKAGIEMLTLQLAGQVGPFGIRVNCLAPGTILTERLEQRIPAVQAQALAASHPLRRLGSPIDVARAALFLASAESDWITGAILNVAGGMA